MRLDIFATERHFVDHMAPIWHALPEEARGDFVVPRPIAEWPRSRGVMGAGPHSEDTRRPVLVASRGDHKRARQAGRRRIAYIEHGVGQSYAGDPKSAKSPGYAGGGDHEDVSLFLCPNTYSADRWRHAYPRARVEVIGCPKLDTLPVRPAGEEDGIVAVSFHFQCDVAPETRSTFLHYRPALTGLNERFHLIGHGHPRAIDGEPWLRQTYTRLQVERVDDFMDVCRRADVYVCDNSSTLFEFAATGRPVVVLNGPGYRREVNHGGRFWDWATIGLQCDRPADLDDTVARALTDPPEARAERERVLSLVYAFRSGAAERAAGALADWLREADMGMVA